MLGPAPWQKLTFRAYSACLSSLGCLREGAGASGGEEEEESSRMTLFKNVLVYKLHSKSSQQMRGKILCLTRSGAATVAPLLQAGGRALAP